ncbi:MAG: SRPBCC family protein [Planctomycetota bacterium]
MKITEEIIVEATPENVWPYVADPLLMSAWNGKVVEVQRASTALVKRGETFSMTYRMMRNRNERHDIEVVACDPPRVVEYRYLTGTQGKTLATVERYDLAPVEGGVRVVQTMDLSEAGISWYFWLLIKIIMRLGESEGPDSLEKLAQVIAEDTRASVETK